MTGTTGPGRARRERRGETVLQAQQQALLKEPIFARLASEWEEAGRTVPGRPDAEWIRLATPPGVSRLAPP
ncbi:hypothetical protein [Streptacidiphilus monticola]|jgi:hypothetical protein|uniref:Uncharacterized protein n=1 Tax=Streptacidiphilus monticola TaxID=2161674 RepID=A0ABW1GBM8_9ACTN